MGSAHLSSVGLYRPFPSGSSWGRFALDEFTGYLDDVKESFIGIGLGLYDVGAGLYNTVRHPIRTVTGIVGSIAHPIRTIRGIGSSIYSGTKTLFGDDPRASGRIIGNLAGTAAVTAVTYKVAAKIRARGTPIDASVRGGKYPSWTTVRQRYWNKHYGQPCAPKHPVYGVPKELHHIKRNLRRPHMETNLREVWPWEHNRIDPFRHYKGPGP